MAENIEIFSLAIYNYTGQDKVTIYEKKGMGIGVKKILSLILAAVMLMAVLPGVGVLAAEVVDSGKCGDNITWSLTSDGTLTISGTGKMEDYGVYIPDDGLFTCAPWSYKCESITSVVIENGVTSIGDQAFYRCSNLPGITIPDSVTSIGTMAFYECSSVASIKMSKNITRIGGWAFKGTAYYNDEANWENGVLYIRHNLIEANRDKVSGDYSVKDGTVCIGIAAFADCSDLINITIPDSVTSINDVFSGCNSLTSINIATGNKKYTSVDGVIFDKDIAVLVRYPIGKNETKYTIPDGVTNIGDNAFMGCSSLKSITMPNSVASIGDNAFADCNNLTDITLHDGVTSIGDYMFMNCENLTSVTIPDGVTRIGDYTFMNCGSLKSVTIPNSVTSIGEEAFSSCRSLTSIPIPDSVTNIKWGTFGDCAKLISIKIPDGVTEIYGGTFEGCESLTNITIPTTVTNIGGSAFYGCENLRDVYYSGSEEQWELIDIVDGIDNENEPLKKATIHFNADMKDIPTVPTTSGKTGVSFSDVNKNQDFYNAVTYLSEKSILSGYTDGTFRPYGTITRAEAATVMVRMLGLEGSVTQGKTNFTDVPADNWAAGYINAAEAAGIISGMGDGTFEPNGEVTYEQIVKMVVCALGYEAEAVRNGGYPSGYLRVAGSQLDITDGVSGTVGNAASRATVAMIIYNAMMINK